VRIVPQDMLLVVLAGNYAKADLKMGQGAAGAIAGVSQEA
jgi:hypothetical protein